MTTDSSPAEAYHWSAVRFLYSSLMLFAGELEQTIPNINEVSKLFCGKVKGYQQSVSCHQMYKVQTESVQVSYAAG